MGNEICVYNTKQRRRGTLSTSPQMTHDTTADDIDDEETIEKIVESVALDESESNDTDTDTDTEETEQEESEGQSVDRKADVSYILLHKGGSRSGYEKINEQGTIEAEIARSRGEAEIADIQTNTTNGDREVSFDTRVTEGRLRTDTNYLLRFVPDQYVSEVDGESLTYIDILKIDTLTDYPASESVIRSLPPQVSGILDEQGYVAIQAVYDSNTQRLYGVQLGWDTEEEIDPWDTMMEVISQVGSTTAAVDYLYIKYGPDYWGVEEIADARDVDTVTVEGNVRMIENELATFDI